MKGGHLSFCHSIMAVVLLQRAWRRRGCMNFGYLYDMVGTQQSIPKAVYL